MVSMIVVLFLLAVLVSLFLGRLAETLSDRLRDRMKIDEPKQESANALVDVADDKVA